MFGAQISLLVGIVGAGVSLIIGVTWGATAGYVGGRTDSSMMRFVDILYSLPSIIFVIVLITTLHGALDKLQSAGKLTVTMRDTAKFVGLFVGLGAVSWLTMARIVRGQVLSLRTRQFVDASRALGATPWQTLSRVVLLTASPGIFSGVMIGLGRAVGETMIVLMSTGNTPVMDLSIFQGFRALSANIAVEMPESELNSTHYRVLFLAALVLFLTTFVFNTVAEVVRQRLRRRYGNL